MSTGMIIPYVWDREDVCTGYAAKRYEANVHVKIQIDLDDNFQDAFEYRRSSTTHLRVIGNDNVEEYTTKSSRHKNMVNKTVFYWSESPFVVIESWESPLDGQWVHLAKQVGKKGLKNRLPQLTLPTFHPSHAGWYERSEESSKWCRLQELSEKLLLSPQEILNRMEPYFEGYDSGVHIIRAESPEALAEVERYSYWRKKYQEDAQTLDLPNIWVRKRFALVVAYFKRVGWPAR